MYVYAVRGNVPHGKAEEFAQKWRDFYGPRAREMPEFQRTYFSADRATNTVLVVWLMSKKPDEAQERQALQECTSQISDLAAGLYSPTRV